jgi:hypothetical protein
VWNGDDRFEILRVVDLLQQHNELHFNYIHLETFREGWGRERETEPPQLVLRRCNRAYLEVVTQRVDEKLHARAQR